MENNELVVKPDTPEDIRNTDIVQLSRKLLGSVVESTQLLNTTTMTEEKLKEAKLVLGFLNATTHAVKTKLSFFKMTGVTDKIKELEKRNQNL